MTKRYGIIFFKFDKHTLYLYLKKNSEDKYEDIIINNNNNILDINLAPLYKLFLDDKNILYFIDINKYKILYDHIVHKLNKPLECISYNTFIKPSIHRYSKINKLQNNIIETILDKIKLNYVIRLASYI